MTCMEVRPKECNTVFSYCALSLGLRSLSSLARFSLIHCKVPLKKQQCEQLLQ